MRYLDAESICGFPALSDRMKIKTEFGRYWIMKKDVIAVEGLMCKNCDAKTEKTVGALTGVISVKSDFETGGVLVEYDETAVSLAEIKAAINAIDDGKFKVIG
jgi:copper chaperone